MLTTQWRAARSHETRAAPRGRPRTANRCASGDDGTGRSQPRLLFPCSHRDSGACRTTSKPSKSFGFYECPWARHRPSSAEPDYYVSVANAAPSATAILVRGALGKATKLFVFYEFPGPVGTYAKPVRVGHRPQRAPNHDDGMGAAAGAPVAQTARRAGHVRQAPRFRARAGRAKARLSVALGADGTLPRPRASGTHQHYS